MKNVQAYYLPKDLQITEKYIPEFAEILTPMAVHFVMKLHREFNGQRLALLKRRAERQVELDNGRFPGFLQKEEISSQKWKVRSTPKDLQDRRVEITGPVERKMMINALNSGASVYMADFEDSTSPTWSNLLQGQINLRDTVNRNIYYISPDQKQYRLHDKVATLMVRPRGWHLEEKHVLFQNQPISASLFDFGLYFFHNAKSLLEKGTGPYFYLPKLESHEEARLWNDVFIMAQEEMGIPQGTIKATVLIETILAAFEMKEIIYELKDHMAGLNAGRWDYIFSIIKKFRNHGNLSFPDRAQITMAVPFMQAYTSLLVKTCHQYGTHAIGGMSAYIPTRKNPQANELALQKVREDKEREAKNGFDGTWVAHPDLVPLAMEVFDKELGSRPHQKEQLREDVNVSSQDLLNPAIQGGKVTEEGLRNNISVSVQYLESWLRGTGAVAINNLMEDTATAEISRSQVWHWIHHSNGILSNGAKVTKELCAEILDQEVKKLEKILRESGVNDDKLSVARKIVWDLVSNKEFKEFLTIAAYPYLG